MLAKLFWWTVMVFLYVLEYIYGILFLLIFVVPFHEAGHYFAAKILGISVESINIGFGANMLSYHFWGLDWGINVLPLGMYVQVDAESLLSATFWSSELFFAAGLMVNVISVLVFILLVRLPLPRRVLIAFTLMGRANALLFAINISPFPICDGAKMLMLALRQFVLDDILSSVPFAFAQGVLGYFVASYLMGVITRYSYIFRPPLR